VAVLPIIPCGTCEGCRATGQPFHCDHYQFIGSRNDGGFAEYCAVKEENLFPLAEGQDLKVGAMIELFSVGLHVVRRSGFKRGRSVVFGAGPVGLACAQWLDYLGSEVTVVDVRDYSLGIAKSLGLNAAKFDELGDGKRFDFAYEASGASAALTRAVVVTKDLGTVTVVGRNAGDTVFSSAVFEKLMRKELTLNGCWGYNLAGEEALMRSFLASRDVRSMISHLIPLDQTPEVLEKVVRSKGEYCKIMIDMGA
jgi:L-iditol 2-dehydrogenase